MPDQADQLRAIVRQAIDARPVLGAGLPIVVVSGGATGVGTTTLALQLARELARIGKPAVLVDANLTKPEMAERLGFSGRGSLTDVLGGGRSAAEVISPIGAGMHLLSSRLDEQSPPDLSHAAIGRLLSELRGLHALAEVVIVDAGHDMSPWVQRWWRAAQQVFLVTTSAEAAVKGSYLALKLAPWGDADGKVRLVINQCDDRAAAEGIAHRFIATCRRFLGLHIDGAPTIACMHEQTGAHDAYRQSVRLLAAEVVSASLVVSGRVPRRGAKRQRIAELLALPEFSPNSANNSQSFAEE